MKNLKRRVKTGGIVITVLFYLASSLVNGIIQAIVISSLGSSSTLEFVQMYGSEAIAFKFISGFVVHGFFGWLTVKTIVKKYGNTNLLSYKYFDTISWTVYVLYCILSILFLHNSGWALEIIHSLAISLFARRYLNDRFEKMTDEQLYLWAIANSDIDDFEACSFDEIQKYAEYKEIRDCSKEEIKAKLISINHYKKDAQAVILFVFRHKYLLGEDLIPEEEKKSERLRRAQLFRSACAKIHLAEDEIVGKNDKYNEYDSIYCDYDLQRTEQILQAIESYEPDAQIAALKWYYNEFLISE